jgi:hypothetical protein
MKRINIPENVMKYKDFTALSGTVNGFPVVGRYLHIQAAEVVQRL